MAALCPSLIGPALCQSVDIYCERTSAAFFAEPLNAVSNLAFIIAGWVAWQEFWRSQSPHDDALLAAIIAIIPIVGIGSFAFHTLATGWAQWADVIPILIFMLLYLWLAMRRYVGWSRVLSSLALLVFALATLALETRVPAQFLWGGAMYLPTVAVCLAIALAPIDVDRRVRRTIAIAVSLFVFGFTLRSLDAPMCTALPIGMHYFWHISNATVLYLFVHAAILHGRRRPQNAQLRTA